MLPTVILALAMMALLLWARRGLWRLTILSLPGTFAHELSHLLVGTALFAKPNAISLMPRHVGNTYVLGSVSFPQAHVLELFLEIWNDLGVSARCTFAPAVLRASLASRGVDARPARGLVPAWHVYEVMPSIPLLVREGAGAARDP